MASLEVYDAVRNFLEASGTLDPLKDANNVVPSLVFDNEGTAPPQVPVWIDVELVGTLYGQQSIGAPVQADNRWDEEGVLFLHVMTKAGYGSRENRRVAKGLADLFRGKTDLLSGDLEFRDAVIGRGLPALDGAWFDITVTVDWRRFESPQT